MFYKIKDNILFRKYEKFGVLTDNSEHGYHFLNETCQYPGEKYVSISGAIMLNMLSKKPQLIDDIIPKLLHFFTDVEYKTLKQDTIDFFNLLVNDGFLDYGETIETCTNQFKIDNSKTKKHQNNIVTNTCILKEIEQNKILKSIHIDITEKCNEHCIHCYIPNDCRNSVMDSSLFYRIIDEGRKMNIMHVTLSGGEPLLHKDILGFLKKCRDLDLSVNVLSNLTLLTDDIISEMKKNILLSVQVSLYSMDALVHDNITKLKGSFEKTKNGILRLLNEGIPVQISCPIIKQNKDCYNDVLRWGIKHNIIVVVEPMIFAVYNHSARNLKNRLSIDEINKILTMQIEKKDYAKSIYDLAQFKEKLTNDTPICSICQDSFCITSTGKVFPCSGWQNNIIGDLNHQTIHEIWETSKKIKKLRQINRSWFSKCMNCKDRGYCTICMMWNSNENIDGDPFTPPKYRCDVATLIHNRVIDVLQKNI